MTMQRQYRCSTEPADLGPDPAVIDIARKTARNQCFRKAIWTGAHLQVTLMTIPVGGDIGVELHTDTDQFLRIEQGCALVRFGRTREEMHSVGRAFSGDAILVPAGTWHNVVNCGRTPLRLYSVYAPPHHPHGTVHATKDDAEH
jgi:mannose-6-phosphate isomerase-like protein (cupin superfamily)